MLFLLFVLPVSVSPSDIQPEPGPHLLSDLAALDDSVATVFSLLPEQVAAARVSIANNKARANRLSVSYSLGVAVGTLLTIDVRSVY